MTEIAYGTRLSLSLVCLLFNGKRRVSSYAAARLAAFFGITVEQLMAPGTIPMETLPVRPVGRIAYRIHRGSTYQPPYRDWRTAVRATEALDSQSLPDFLRRRVKRTERKSDHTKF